ncbi:MAG TPA: hypothetical protein VH280_10515 [Verrucomicrobiae bacterium]|nr:hypothetical protein [Verrucomicrobiae bacterium]
MRNEGNQEGRARKSGNIWAARQRRPYQNNCSYDQRFAQIQWLVHAVMRAQVIDLTFPLPSIPILITVLTLFARAVHASGHTAFDGKIGNLQHFQWSTHSSIG